MDDVQVQQLQARLKTELGTDRVVTLRTNVSVPATPGSRSKVQRPRWFTVIDPEPLLLERLATFADRLASLPYLTCRWDGVGRRG